MISVWKGFGMHVLRKVSSEHSIVNECERSESGLVRFGTSIVTNAERK